jgi:Fe-S oxidoreductase
MELCLSCKACKTECPTGVDMARLKAEWLAHRNTAAGASATARCFAAAPAFSAIGSYMPALSNWLGQSQFARRLLDRWLNIDARVPPPSFAKQTFRAWFRRHKPPRHFHQDRDVVYIVDTWTNAYWPAAGIAAVRLLESIGYRVVVPPLRCCGRPLISEGFLDDAAALARTNVDLLTPYLRRGCPIVGTEPSCISAYRDEYPHFVRTDAARELAEAVCSVEAVLVESGAVRPRTAGAGSVLYHGHCHQKALWGTGQIRSLAQRLGVPLREIDSGCCGMAGSFGHDRRHYDVATAIGAQRLFPAIRSAPKAEVLVSGFSCREQIAHHCGRVPRHVLEAFADALCPHGS